MGGRLGPGVAGAQRGSQHPRGVLSGRTPLLECPKPARETMVTPGQLLLRLGRLSHAHERYCVAQRCFLLHFQSHSTPLGPRSPGKSSPFILHKIKNGKLSPRETKCLRVCPAASSPAPPHTHRAASGETVHPPEARFPDLRNGHGRVPFVATGLFWG